MRRRHCTLICFICSLITSLGCTPERSPQTTGVNKNTSTSLNLGQKGSDSNLRKPYEFFTWAMGTEFTLTLLAYDEDTALIAAQAAFREIKRVERLVSSWIPESEISQINQAAGKNAVTIDAETHWLLAESKRISEISEGTFDITWAALKGLWNFKSKHRPSPAEITQRVRYIGNHYLMIDPSRSSTHSPRQPLQWAPTNQSKVNESKSTKPLKYVAKLTSSHSKIDLGGIAKGYGVDAASQVLRALGYHDFLLNGGGDLFAEGHQLDGSQWTIGIQHPRNHQSLFATVHIPAGWAVVTSGDYERFFIDRGQRFHHIIDIRSGYPGQLTTSVTVVARKTYIADALSTAFFILGPRAGIALANKLPEVEALFMSPTGEVTQSRLMHRFIQSVPQRWQTR